MENISNLTLMSEIKNEKGENSPTSDSGSQEENQNNLQEQKEITEVSRFGHTLTLSKNNKYKKIFFNSKCK
jgi:hypothetical protein